MEAEENNGYPMPQFGAGGHASEGSLHYQIDVNEIISDIEHTLMCELLSYNQDKKRMEWRRHSFIKPVINEFGLNKILVILKSRLTKIFILSDLTEEAIYQITRHVGENVIDDIYYNWDDYEIADDAAASLVVGTVSDTVFATLNKAKNGKYLKFLSTTQQVSEIQHYANQKRTEPSGSDSSIMGFLRRRKKH